VRIEIRTPFQFKSFKVDQGYLGADQKIILKQVFRETKCYGVGFIRLTRCKLQWQSFANFVMGLVG
jgi:hypothetical protein